MAIDAYMGLPGSGKSYGVVEYCVIPSLKEGRHVVTNIPLEVSLLTSVYGGEITQLPDDWYEDIEFSESIPNGCVLILDEVWRKYPSGQKVNQVPVQDMALLKEHRHRVDATGKAMRVILVTQDAADLSSWVRKLVAHAYRMEKLDALGSTKRFRVDIYKGCPTGDNPPKRLLIRQTTGTYKPEIYQYYRSATQSDSVSAGDETMADKRSNIWHSKWLWFCLIFGTLGPIFGVIAVLDYLQAPVQPKESKSVPAIQPEQSPAMVNPPPPGLEPVTSPLLSEQVVTTVVPADQPPKVVLSTTWRVAGYLDKSKASDPNPDLNRQVLLATVTGMRRIVAITDCQYYEGEIDVYCDVDGERITPWTGQQTATGILPPQVQTVAAVTTARGEQSEQSAVATAAPVQPPARSPVIVADTSRAPRTIPFE
ncbi:zonular occludens toxin domain-containing protein [Pseudomonas anguilliseptica]|uniref:Zona occludens toxin n=1 Tax=Pseudomonas anguilliseptica TaxID=53406 RepID=A0A1H5G1W0_PSEAG|nr:zonular occludens toxin domain-containing protein [Pseudomonas anguilliseptica]SEE09057.1 zona occludens toxin [Pseudomonas anguilliseptica]SEE09369.1 zona occludens toxin [Pseudomonas anguilliseptica]SEE09732.1 zona occludens toxin [Pseudomonas anguilliseptica]